MPTFTTRLGLRKPATSDNVNIVTDLNDNYDDIDNHLGHLVCTSASRPTGSDRFQGRTIYETDTLQTAMWDGSAWVYMNGNLTGGYTFQITGATSGTATNGNSTINTFYHRNGQWVDFFCRFTHGNSGVSLSVVGSFNFLLPPVAATSSNGTIIGTGLISQATSGDRYVCAVMIEDSTHHSLVVTRASSAIVANAVPYTGGWANNDTIRIQGRYRCV